MTLRNKKNKKNAALDTVVNPEPTPLAVEKTLERIAKTAKDGGNIFDKATLIVLNFEGIGGSRKIKTAQLDAQADFDERVVGANKKLFAKCEEYLAIKRSEAEMRAFINRKALPSYFMRGSYLVPNRFDSGRRRSVEGMQSEARSANSFRRSAIGMTRS